MRTTPIEWTEHTWNPFVGCSVHSAGCKNCYAMQQAFRIESFGTAPHYQGIATKANGRRVWTGKISRASDRAMNKPRTIRHPSLIFVNSMSDFFHGDADAAWQIEAMRVVESCPEHTFQILTKRPENIPKFSDRYGSPFPGNVWVGTTVENQAAAWRVDALKNADAAVRFISFEPLIGSTGDLDLSGIHWAISGGESGARSRECNPKWVREVRDWCDLWDVPFFHKQWGDYRNNPIVFEGGGSISDAKAADPCGKGGSLIDGCPRKDWPHSFVASSPVADSQRATIASTFDGSISTL